MCNKKLVGVRYFYEGMKKVKTCFIQGKDSARDTLGHGTFVSSVAIGNYVAEVSYFGDAKEIAKGVAPRARLAAYKVIRNNGITVSSGLLAAIDQAIAEGVDIICASFGSLDSLQLHKNALAIASLSAMQKGILVV